MYEYKTVSVSLEEPSNPSGNPHGRRATIADAANNWARSGWRTIAVMPSQGPGYADEILVERWLSDGHSGG